MLPVGVEMFVGRVRTSKNTGVSMKGHFKWVPCIALDLKRKNATGEVSTYHVVWFLSKPCYSIEQNHTVTTLH